VSGHDHDRPFTYSEELSVTRQLIDGGDLPHALHHCIGALGLEPQRREWQPLLRELLASKAVRQKLDDDNYYGAKAALAWHLHETGAITDALDIIGAVAVAVPHKGFQAWFGAWLEEAATKKMPIDSGTVIRVLLLGTTFGIGRIKLLPTEQLCARELAPMARFAVHAVPDPQILMLASAVMRRAALHTEALEYAERYLEAGGDPAMSATVIGLALRAKGEPEKALPIFEKAYATTGDPIYLLEKFRAHVDAGQWSDAQQLAERIAAEREPDGENLMEFSFADRAAEQQLPRPSSPPLDDVRRRALGHAAILSMTEATTNALTQIMTSDEMRDKSTAERIEDLRTNEIVVEASANEGPSTRLTMALMCAGSTDPRAARYGSPDPLVMIEDEADQYTLWKVEDDVAVQALPAPPDAVLEWVLELAESDAADFLALWDEAKDLPRATARDWLGAAIHPRMPLAEVEDGPRWVYHWQLCSLIGLAKSEPGWEGTAKRDALLSLLRGAIDWPLAAAIRVAAEVALYEPTAAPELRQRFLDLREDLEHVPNSGIPVSLLLALEMTPYVSKELIEPFRASLAARNSDDDDSDDDADDDADDDTGDDDHDHDHGDDKPDPPGKKPWWKLWGT